MWDAFSQIYNTQTNGVCFRPCVSSAPLQTCCYTLEPMCNGKSVIQRVCRLCITIQADQECDREIQMSAKGEFEWQRWRF